DVALPHPARQRQLRAGAALPLERDDLLPGAPVVHGGCLSRARSAHRETHGGDALARHRAAEPGLGLPRQQIPALGRLPRAHGRAAGHRAAGYCQARHHHHRATARQMRIAFQPLATVLPRHPYYAQGCRDIEFVPTSATADLLRAGRSIARTHEGALHLFYELDDAPNTPLSSLAGRTLYFALRLANLYFVNFTTQIGRAHV